MFSGDPLEREARVLGYRLEVCEPCYGKGVAKHADMNQPTGWRVEDPCSGCEGSGRMWSVRGNLPWLRDREMRDVIERQRGVA